MNRFDRDLLMLIIFYILLVLIFLITVATTAVATTVADFKIFSATFVSMFIFFLFLLIALQGKKKKVYRFGLTLLVGMENMKIIIHFLMKVFSSVVINEFDLYFIIFTSFLLLIEVIKIYRK